MTAGCLLAMAALLVTPYAFTAALPAIGAIAGTLAVTGAVAYTVKRVCERRRKPAAAVPDQRPVWPLPGQQVTSR
jgi:nitrate reductase gamma subunit